MTSKLAARLREIMHPAASGSGRPQAEPDDAPGAGLQVGREPHSAPPPVGLASDIASDPRSIGRRLADAAAGALGGWVRETSAGPCVIVERTYRPEHVHGRLSIGDCACQVQHDAPGLPILAGARPDLPVSGDQEADVPPAAPFLPVGDIVFLDLETTGLAGGAGTYAFLVGCGWFEAGAFRVRQYFMVGHALERALLAGVRERLEATGTLVTYNGKSFDVPVLETRFQFNRQHTSVVDRAHIDMLHHARRLWRGARPMVDAPGAQTESCTLAALEHALFGVQRTGDVPGFEIPTRYFAFLRSGDARPLEPVLEHNRLDLVSLAALTARALRLLADPALVVERPRECLGLAVLLARVGRWERAEACYRRAVELGARSWHRDDEDARVEALHALALRCRRTGRYLDAAAHWDAITRARRCPPGLLREALEALAIHHEHRSRDLEQARRFAEQTRRVAGAYPGVERRLARIERKMGQHGPDPDAPRNVTLWR